MIKVFFTEFYRVQACGGTDEEGEVTIITKYLNENSTNDPELINELIKALETARDFAFPKEKDWRNYSVSHATMRPQDLIPAFLELIKEIAPEKFKGLRMDEPFSEPPNYALEDDDSAYWDSETCSWFLNETLWTILEEHAPEGFYFGSHPGNGSDYGFWECTEVEIE